MGKKKPAGRRAGSCGQCLLNGQTFGCAGTLLGKGQLNYNVFEFCICSVLVHFLRREYREARDLEVLNLAQFEKAGARLRMSDSLMLLAVASIFIDDLAAAGDYLTRSLRLTSGVVTDELAGLVVSSHYALHAGRLEDAARLAGAAQAISLETGVTNAALNILHLPDPADLVRERLGEQADAFLAEGRAMSFDEAVLLARSLTEPSETAAAGSAG